MQFQTDVYGTCLSTAQVVSLFFFFIHKDLCQTDFKKRLCPKKTFRMSLSHEKGRNFQKKYSLCGDIN